MKKLLFITHDTSRTGAPLVLLYFLKWIKQKELDTKISVLAIKGGGLKNEFRQVSDNYYDLELINNTKISSFAYLRSLFRGKIVENNEIEFIDRLSNEKFDVIYANTIVAVPLAYRIHQKSTHSKFVAHIHELETIIRLKLPNFKEYHNNIDLIISASDLVRKNLVENHNISSKKIKTIYEFTSNNTRIHNKSNEFIVLGMGTAHWRKGSDLFIQVASLINKLHPKYEIKFRWIGSISKSERIILEMDLKKLGLEEIVKFIGEKENPIEFYGDASIYLLTSREDPFPLAAIELGIGGKPIICFQGATGTEEVLKNGGGHIVPYMDINEMKNKIIEYYENRELVSIHGKEARRLFLNFLPENICPTLFSTLKNL